MKNCLTLTPLMLQWEVMGAHIARPIPGSVNVCLWQYQKEWSFHFLLKKNPCRFWKIRIRKKSMWEWYSSFQSTMRGDNVFSKESLRAVILLHSGEEEKFFTNMSIKEIRKNSRKGIAMLKSRIFVDMDGTLCQWLAGTPFEDLFRRRYFLDLPAMYNVVDAVKLLLNYEQIEIFILSAYLEDSPYALTEKHLWLDKHFGSVLDDEHRIFVPTTKSKADAVPGGIREGDILLDDYSRNLIAWEAAGGTGVKLLNGVNGQGIKWKGLTVSAERTPEIIRNGLWGLTISSFEKNKDKEDRNVCKRR